MRLEAAPLPGAFLVHAAPIADERGHFARTFDAAAFAKAGLDARVSQCSVSFNRVAGTLRGLHYQVAPFEEVKLVRCSAGALFDVIVDLRASSPTKHRWFGIELSARNMLALYVPSGFAHGFQTLADNTEVTYQISETYHPEAARGIRWDDPHFAIHWPPCSRRVVSPRDLSWPDYTP